MINNNLLSKHSYPVKYATGKRKRAIARVYITKGEGKITVNNMDYQTYFPRQLHKVLVKQPLDVVNTSSLYDIKCFVLGGGHSGQAGAVKHGISKVLSQLKSEFHHILRNIGYLTRDDRRVERKKPGQPKARKKFQFSKR
jgi:small subunit ribosomal protein S9